MSSEIRFLDQVIETTELCRYCLMCRHACPVGYVTKNETLTPHGWGLTVAAVKRGMLTWNEETVGVMYQCADCGSCNAHCATDQPLPEAIAAARAEIVGQNLAPAGVYALDTLLRRWGNPYREQTPEPVQGTGDVALFVGDEAVFLWPSALKAALKLLEAIGVRPVLIGAGRSSGYVPASLGLTETAATLVSATLDELTAAGAQTLLVLTPGDAFAFEQMSIQRLNLPFPQGVVLQEVVTLLAGALDDGKLKLKQRSDGASSAYIDPSHTVRVKTRTSAPRQLMAATLPDQPKELFWRTDRAHPTGASALQFTYPDLATELTRSRLRDAAGAGARRIFCEAPGDLYHLARHAAEFGLEVVGLYEHLAAHLV